MTFQPSPTMDSLLAGLLRRARDDRATAGLLIHGLRAVRIVDGTDPSAPGDPVRERLTSASGRSLEVVRESLGSLERRAGRPDRHTSSYLAATVAFDRSGEVAHVLERMADVAGARAHDAVPEARTAYRAALERALEAANRHDQLSLRLHASDSVRALVRVLFGLERRWPPEPERLAAELEPIERAQTWPAGYLPWILLHLLRDPAPRRQLELARRVDRLLVSRGIDPVLDATEASAPRTAPAVRQRATEGVGA